MLLTGCDYMFWSLLLSVTVDVLVSTAEDDGKIKRSVNTSSCYLSLPPPPPPFTTTLLHSAPLLSVVSHVAAVSFMALMI